MNIKKALVLPITGLLLLGVTTGCAASSDDKAKASSDYTIIDISGPVSDPFFGSFKQGSDAAAKDLGIDYEYTASKDYTDLVPTYERLTRAAIGKKPDALIIGDYFPETLEPLIKQAVAKGIPVFVTNSGRDSWQKLGALGFIGENPTAMGQEAGKVAVKAGATNAICVNQIAGNPVLEQRCNGFLKQVTDAGGKGKILTIPTEDASNEEKVRQSIAGALNANKDVDSVLTLGSSIATAALAAADQAGMGDKVKVGTVDISTNVLESVKSGKLLFALDQQPYLQGYYGVLQAYQWLEYGLRPTNAIDSGPQVITKDNVDRVLAVQKAHRGVRGAS